MRKRRVLHIIPSLEQGGAERMLASFVANDRAVEHIVVKLFASDGLFEDDVRKGGARLVELGIIRSPLAALTVPIAIIRLLVLLVSVKPTVVIGWLYYGALASVFAWFVRVPVIWSIHASDFDLKTSYRPLTRTAIRVCRRLSRRVPNYIQYCSGESMTHHVTLGFSSVKSGVVENAVPLDTQPATTAATRVRGDRIRSARIACIARFEAQKDHDNLLTAAAHLARHGHEFRLLLAGAGCTDENEALRVLIARHGVAEQVECLGILSDIPALIASCHCTVLASNDGEAMPMVLLESIAHGRPVVVTDVGSCKRIVHRFGLVVPPKDPKALADALVRVVWDEPVYADAAARDGQRFVVDNFSISQFVKRWHAIFETLGV